jgi:hypothetical protein
MRSEVVDEERVLDFEEGEGGIGVGMLMGTEEVSVEKLCKRGMVGVNAAFKKGRRRVTLSCGCKGLTGEGGVMGRNGLGRDGERGKQRSVEGWREVLCVANISEIVRGELR